MATLSPIMAATLTEEVYAVQKESQLNLWQA